MMQDNNINAIHFDKDQLANNCRIVEGYSEDVTAYQMVTVRGREKISYQAYLTAFLQYHFEDLIEVGPTHHITLIYPFDEWVTQVKLRPGWRLRMAVQRNRQRS